MVPNSNSNSKKSSLIEIQSLSGSVPLLLTNNSHDQENKEQVILLNNLKIEASYHFHAPSNLFSFGIVASLNRLESVVSRSALFAVNHIITLISLPPSSVTSVLDDTTNDLCSISSSGHNAVKFHVSLDLTFNNITINAPMTDYLIDACGGDGDSNEVNMAVQLESAKFNVNHLEDLEKLQFDGSLKHIVVFEECGLNTQGGECLVVQGIEVKNISNQKTVKLDVDAVKGRWSPLVTKCFGALSGAIARELFDVLFDRNGPTQTSPLTEAVKRRVSNPLNQDAINALLTLDQDTVFNNNNGNNNLSEVAVVITCHLIEIDFPFKLWHSVSSMTNAQDLSQQRCGAFLKSMESLYGEWDSESDWECIAVRVQGGTVVVKTPENELPIIQMKLTSTELSSSGLDEWTELRLNDTTKKHGCCLRCETFALESFSDRVIELCISQVRARWSSPTQLRILKAARDVTYSVWDSLLCYRMLKYKDRNPTLRINAPLDDASELMQCALRFRQVLGATGDKLHRLYADTIHVEIASAVPLVDSSCFADVSVARLSSVDLPEIWNVEGVSMAITGHPTLSLESLAFRRTLDRSPTLVVGVALNELRTRYNCVLNKQADNDDVVDNSNRDIDRETHVQLCLQNAKEAMDDIIPIYRHENDVTSVGEGREGFLISLSGLVVRVGTQFRIADTVSDEGVHLQGMVSALMALPGRWIPGCDNFKRLFRSSTTYEHILFGDIKGPQPAPEMWIQLKQADLSLADDPMEAWLERAYPLWLDELERRWLREEQLRKRMVAVKVTNSVDGALALSSVLQTEFLQSNSRYYIARAQEEGLSFVDIENDRVGDYRADKLGVSVSSCDMHVIIPKSEEDSEDVEGSGGRRRGHALIRSLDSCPPPLNAAFDVFAFTSFSLSASELTVKVRRFKTPIFASEAVKLNGVILLTTTKAPYPKCYRVSEVMIEPGIEPQTVVQSFELPRVYLELTGHVCHPYASYSPAYEFGLEEIAASCGALYPDSMTLDPSEKLHNLRWWDSGRRLITTRMDITADDMNLSLLPSLRTFIPKFKSNVLDSLSLPALSVFSSNDFAASIHEHIKSGNLEELRIICESIRLRYERMQITTDVQGMLCQQMPAPKNALPLASLPCAALTMSYEWECTGDAANYHFYPIVCEDGQIVDLTVKQEAGANEQEDKFHNFRSHGLRLHLSAKLLPAVQPIALHFGGDCSPLFSSSTHNAPWVHNPASSTNTPNHPVIVIYMSSLAWLVNWANAFKRIPNVPYPEKSRPAVDSGIWGLKAHIRAIKLDESGIDGLAKFIVLDQPSTNTQNSQGVIISAHNSSVSMCVTEETTFPNPFLTGKLSTDPDDPTRLWVVHGVTVSVGHIDGLVVEPNKNKDQGCFDHGLFLFSAASLGFDQSVVSSDGVTLRHSLESSRRTDHASSPSPNESKDKEDVNKEEQEDSRSSNKRTTNELVNPMSSSMYGLADSYLNAVSINDVRVCITVAARDALKDFSEEVVSILSTSLLDEGKPRDDLLQGTALESEAAKKEETEGTEGLLSMEGLGLDSTSLSDQTIEGVPNVTVRDESPTPQSSLDTMGGLFLIRINAVQVQALDIDSKASILVALPSMIVQGWIGQSTEPASSPAMNRTIDSSGGLAVSRQCRTESAISRGVVEEMLQRLVRKELPQFVEATHIQLRGTALLEAPTDLDGGGDSTTTPIRWLPSGCLDVNNSDDWKTGVFNTILAPVSTIEVGVVVEHDAVPIHSVRVGLPTLEVSIDSDAMRRTLGVVMAMSTFPESTDEDKKEDDDEKETIQKKKFINLTGSNDMNAIGNAWHDKQAAQWKLNTLQCLLRILLLMNEQEEKQDEDKKVDKIQGLESNSANLRSWISSTKKHIEEAAESCKTTKTFLDHLVSATKRRLQVQPHMHLVAFIGGVSVTLVSHSKQPIASLHLDKISAIFANYLDESGSLEFDLHEMNACFHQDGETQQVLVALDKEAVRKIGNTVRKGGLGRMYLWDHVESMVRVQATLGTPHNRADAAAVDIRHFEVVLVPLVINLTRRFVVSLMDFFMIPDEETEKKLDDQSRDTFLYGVPSPRPSSQSHTSSFNSFPQTSQTTSTNGVMDESIRNKNGGGGGGSQRDARALLFGHGETKELKESDKGFDDIKLQKLQKNNKKESDNVLETRAHVQYLRLGQLVAFVSYKGENWSKLEDFDSLQVKIHPYVIRNQTCSLGELAIGVRNHIVVDILSQVGRNFVNIGAFLASKFNNIGGVALCGQPEWSTGAVLPQIEPQLDDEGDEDEENDHQTAGGGGGEEPEYRVDDSDKPQIDGFEIKSRLTTATVSAQDTSPQKTSSENKDLLLGPNKQKKVGALSNLRNMSLFKKKL